MELLQPDLRSRYSVGGSFKIPPLISSDPELGPLRFSPDPESLSVLFSSPSLVSPSLLPPPQQLSLTRFLVTTTLVPLSTSSSIASLYGPSQYNEAAASESFANNRLQLLRCPSTSNVAAFFPTGTNSDQVGFVILGHDSRAQVNEDGDVFRSNKRFNLPIVRILVNPIQSKRFSSTGEFIGYLMAFTMNSVHWFAVKRLSNTVEPLIYLCSKVFKSSAVAGACWSRKLPETSAVLLENGNLFLFDLEPFLHLPKDNSINPNIRGTRLEIEWSNQIGYLENNKNNKWLGCEFGYGHKTLIVSHSYGAYFVDFQSDQCSVKCVANIEVKDDPFVAFSKADSDGFLFALASKRLLVLYDVRRPLRHVLQWVHNIHNPIYIDMFRLSELRSNPWDNKFRWASESGNCVVLSSFWECEFSLFCYGPAPPSTEHPLALKLSQMCKSLFAWGLPSELLLSSLGFSSSSFLMKEETSKDNLPEWVHWQQKKDMVLGFGILRCSSSGSEELGGFTVIRLMSSGKLESQRYRASWEYPETIEEEEEDGKETSKPFRDYVICSEPDEDYKFTRRFKYLNLRYLEEHFKANLASALGSESNNSALHTEEKDSFDYHDFHTILCENRKKCGSSSSSAFDDISLPSSIDEIALRRMWSKLPVELLLLAFSSYSEFREVLSNNKRVSLEFLVVSDSVLPQSPPFMLRKPSNRSNKWSNRVQRTDAMVGPVVPLPVLSAIHNGSGEEDEFSLLCDEVMQEATQVAMVMADSSSGLQFDGENAISLADDRDPWGGGGGSENQKMRFVLHEPGAFESQRGAKLVSKVFEKDSLGGDGDSMQRMFDDMFPIKLKFKDDDMVADMYDDDYPIKLRVKESVADFGQQELKALKDLKQLWLFRRQNVDIATCKGYKDFLSQCELLNGTELNLN